MFSIFPIFIVDFALTVVGYVIGLIFVLGFYYESLLNIITQND
jgi:hypothetical protein